MSKLDLEEFLPYRLSVLSNTVSGAIAETYSDQFGLSIPEWRVVAVLGRFAGISAGQVAQRTAMDKVAVSRAVARLTAAGRVKRDFADADRRRSVLTLTAAGRAIYDQVTPMLLDYERALLEELSDVDRRRLNRVLDLLLERARELGPPASRGKPDMA